MFIHRLYIYIVCGQICERFSSRNSIFVKGKAVEVNEVAAAFKEFFMFEEHKAGIGIDSLVVKEKDSGLEPLEIRNGDGLFSVAHAFFAEEKKCWRLCKNWIGK